MATSLVTGASSGVGRAIAIALGEAGWTVLAVGRDPERLAEVATHDGVVAHALDIADRDGLAALTADRDIDMLVNNAGMMPPPGPFHETDPAGLDLAVAINLTAQIALTRMVAPGMVRRGRGHIFFTGSIAAHAAVPDMAVYSATKAGLGGFARALRLDLSPHGVRVTEIVPGRIETGLFRDILSEEERAAMYAAGGAVRPGDVARMVLAAHALPPTADVARIDILPTRPPAAAPDRPR